ncbi:MAG: hypothetical protein WEA31_06075 [Pirellulales bacterium]
MGNKESREFMKQRELFADVLRAKTQDRDVTADVHFLGVGVRRVQLLCMPSFGEGFSWDVRQLKEQWLLYRGIVPSDVRCARGYDRLAADSRKLNDFFHELCAVTLPLKPNMSGTGGADGTLFQLAVFGDLHSRIRFEWWSEYPTQWKPLIEIAERMRKYFQACDVIAHQP